MRRYFLGRTPLTAKYSYRANDPHKSTRNCQLADGIKRLNDHRATTSPIPVDGVASAGVDNTGIGVRGGERRLLAARSIIQTDLLRRDDRQTQLI